MIVYPRLDQQVLLRLLVHYRSLAQQPSTAVVAIRDEVDSSVLAPGRSNHSAVGAELVSVDRLHDLRRSLRAIAESHGYPDRRYGGRSPAWAAYDRETSAHLHGGMDIYPSDAGSRDVWAHFNGWLVPDVVLWRWWVNDKEEDEGDARFAWGSRWFARNQMGRLWWRYEVFGDLYTSGRLGEDQVTALMERPSIGFYPPLARAMAVTWAAELDGLTVSSEDLMRDAAKRLRRLLPSRSLYSMPEGQLRDVVGKAFSASRLALEAGDSR